MAAQLTTGLTQEMSVYYEKVFLARAEYEYIFNQGAQMRTQPSNEGKQINFTRHTPLATATTALTEGINRVCALVKSTLNNWESLRFNLA